MNSLPIRIHYTKDKLSFNITLFRKVFIMNKFAIRNTYFFICQQMTFHT